MLHRRQRGLAEPCPISLGAPDHPDPQSTGEGIGFTPAVKHWGVENNCHHTLDAVLAEDDHPWVPSNATAAMSLMVLRRIAYNDGDSRALPQWRALLRRTYNALIVASAQQRAGLMPPLQGEVSPAAT